MTTMNEKRILVVDDSRTALALTCMLLNGQNWAVSTARDGKEGVEKALAECPDLILMDVMMPVLNGFEAVAELRAAEATRSIPVIMVTTRGEAENVEKGYVVGATDYVTKPIDGVELLEKIRSYLGE